MIDVTPEFIQQMMTDRSFDYAVTITFTSGDIVTLGADDLCVTGCHITTSAGTSALPLGNAFCKVLELQFFNFDDRYKDYDFFKASVHVVLNYQLSETVASIDLGTYTVTEPETYGSIITIKAYDAMYKADKPFEGNITFPTTAALLFAEACYDSNLSPITTVFANSDFTIDALPDQVTNRQIIGAIAMLAGGNALIKNGGVVISTYTLDSSTIEVNYYGGIFDDATPSYATGDAVDGGGFNPWDVGAAADGGTIADLEIQQFFSEVITQTVCTDDVIITGIRMKTDDGVEHLSGSEGYVLDLTNPLVTGKEEAAVIAIGRLLIGIQFRPFELTTMAYPLAEFGDLCYIQHKDVKIASMVTDIDYQLKGVTTIKASADSPLRNSSKSYTGDANIQTLIAARRATERQISRYNTEILRLTELMANSFGTYYTEEVLPDGSVIRYLHDQPLLENSEKIWKRTADAYAVSNDRGVTWTAGLDADGNAMVNILSAIGISADWIDAGHMSADKIDGGHISANLIQGGMLILDGNESDGGCLAIKEDTIGLLTYTDEKGFVVANGGTIDCINRDSLYRYYFRGSSYQYGFHNNAFNISRIQDAKVDFGALWSGGFWYDSYHRPRFDTSPDFLLVGRASAIFGDDFLGLEDVKSARFDLSFNKNDFNYLTLGASANGSSSDPYIMLVNPDLIEEEEGIDGSSYYTTKPYSVWYGTDDEEDYMTAIPPIMFLKHIGTNKNIYLGGTLYSRNTKHRVLATKDYSTRLQYCYETASPYFGDIGTGQTDENGECYVFFDDIFRETIEASHEYAVFLQKEGPGDLWVDTKADGYFLVKGAADTPFSWEIKAKQKDYATERLEKMGKEDEYEEAIPDDGYTEPDYSAEGAQLWEEYINEQEGITT